MRFARTLWLSSNHWLAWFHRWAGVVLCVLFFIWFASGMVLHFVGFPSLSDQDRARFAEEIDLSQLRIEPSAAVAEVSDAQDLRLLSVAGHPRYVIVSATQGLVAIAGDSGERSPPLSSDTARVVAEKFGRHKATAVDGPFDFDQWVVHQQFDLQRPLFRVRMDDDQHTDLYVSARTGEVVQQTHRRERMWNWCGAVIHWIYFTPLRHSWSAWDRTMWSISLVALVTSVAGVWLGFVRLAANRSAGRKGLSPFRGWMRWHHVIGLFASIIVVTWILSGWLSMDHGRLFSIGKPAATESVNFASAAAWGKLSAREISLLPARVREIEWFAFDGRIYRRERLDLTSQRLSLAADATQAPEPGRAFLQPDEVTAAVRRLAANCLPAVAVNVIDDYPVHSAMPNAPVYRSVCGDIWFHVDGASGAMLEKLDASRRAYRWAYGALHTLDFPSLIARPLLRTALIVTLCGLGFAFAVTAMVIAWRRLRRPPQAP